MRHAVFAFVLLLSLGLLAPHLAAQALCDPDEIIVHTNADTVAIEHRHAERNCCYELVVDFNATANSIDFYEGATGDPCRCDCCFDLHYSACGFAAGRYTLRVWNEDGTELFGSADIEIKGLADSPMMLASDRGDCVGPLPTTETSWGLMKKIFR